MGTRDKHEAGTFSWVELATSDAEGAKEFYGKLFGWEYADREIGEGRVYSMSKVGDDTVGGLFEADGPPRWNSYVTVDSVEDAAEKARDEGAEVVMDPTDVGDGAGRMAVIQDPSGAVVSLWEAEDNPGAGIVNAHGALVWNDLMTHDVEKASKFYCELFGWEVAPVGEGPDDDEGDGDEENDSDEDDDSDDDERLVIRNGERLNGGIAKLPEAVGEEVMPHWLPYFGVDDIDAAMKAVEEAGGEQMAGPLDIPTGQIAVLADPQGAIFAVMSGEMED